MFHLPEKGHYAKNYLNKSQAVKLVNFLAKKTNYDPEEDDVECIFFLEDEPSPQTLIALKIP